MAKFAAKRKILLLKLDLALPRFHGCLPVRKYWYTFFIEAVNCYRVQFKMLEEIKFQFKKLMCWLGVKSFDKSIIVAFM